MNKVNAGIIAAGVLAVLIVLLNRQNEAISPRFAPTTNEAPQNSDSTIPTSNLPTNLTSPNVPPVALDDPNGITEDQVHQIRLSAPQYVVGRILNRPDSVIPTPDPEAEQWQYDVHDGGRLNICLYENQVVDIERLDKDGKVISNQLAAWFPPFEREKQREADTENGFH